MKRKTSHALVNHDFVKKKHKTSKLAWAICNKTFYSSLYLTFCLKNLDDSAYEKGEGNHKMLETDTLTASVALL